MTSVYTAPEVAGVLELHPYLMDAAFRALPTDERIATQARRVHAAHRAGDARIGMHVMCWWPGARGRSLDDVLAGGFSEDDARLTMGREYGFDDWEAVRACDETAPDPGFEQALDDMLAGDIEGLRDRIVREPELVSQRSEFGHRTTLLHYVGANGVESHRQVMPLNAVELAVMLIECGASRTAGADMYGGGQTPYALASTQRPST